MSSKEHVFIATRHNGKPAVSLHMIEYAVAKSDPINFDIYGYRARYVPERTCTLEDTTKSTNDDYWHSARCSRCGGEFTCAMLGEDIAAPDANYCPVCGAKVVE